MRGSIILSGRRDPDLISLYRTVGTQEFSRIIKDALRMAIRGGYVPRTKIPEGATLHRDPKPVNVKVDLVITAEGDEDVRVFLSHARKRELGFLVKQAVRFYIGPALTMQAFLDEECQAALQKMAVPVQVFSLGQTVTVTKTVRTKDVVKKDTTKTKETKVIPATPVNTENIAPPSFNLPNPTFDDTANLAPQTETNAGGTNEEDDMLAMLEGLLG